ncbi:nucleoside diphosphate kinase 3 [Lemur catta]|uniref:nucleoside diphosphate kinase 3 n=2 Tax=Lemuridae TaxID=9445 RepID=UPI001E267327|nr:nucleoside diphosphate kinase 3 [Lemur catta]
MGAAVVSEPLEVTWPPQLPSGPPGPLESRGTSEAASGTAAGRRLPAAAEAPLSAGPAPAAPPGRAAAAIMICLVLTIFANLFPAACAGVHERTFLAVKPDGVQRRLVGEVVRRFERKGFKLVALKLVQASEELLREHYAELRERPFYGRLVKYMGSGPVVAMVWQGLDVVRASRALIGATDPADALPGTIRGDFCVEVGKNVIHGSDSVESARREIALWFRAEELLCWEDSVGHWLHE